MTPQQPTEAEREAAQQRIAAWDRAMQRAFKGIIDRKTRLAMLARAAETHA